MYAYIYISYIIYVCAYYVWSLQRYIIYVYIYIHISAQKGVSKGITEIDIAKYIVGVKIPKIFELPPPSDLKQPVLFGVFFCSLLLIPSGKTSFRCLSSADILLHMLHLRAWHFTYIASIKKAGVPKGSFMISIHMIYVFLWYSFLWYLFIWYSVIWYSVMWNLSIYDVI